MEHIMPYEIFEQINNYIMIDCETKDSHTIQSILFEFGYSWSNRGEKHYAPYKDIYLYCYPDNKSLAFDLKSKDLSKDKENALMFVTGEEFLQDPEKYIQL